MRIIIYGVGAIGGTLAVKLAEAGHDIIGIARGKQLEAIRSGGLRLFTPDGESHQHFPAVADPAEITPEVGDIVLLTVKTQDSFAALQRLRAAGFADQPIFCIQNGIANDDMALRLFPNVFGVVVTMPSTYTTPGEVIDFFTPRLGLFDISRHGAGDLAAAHQLAGILDAAGFAAFVHDDLTGHRYGKLLNNLANAVDAVLGSQPDAKGFAAAARAEGEAVLKAAGITPATMQTPERQALAQSEDIPGQDRVGSSSAQSMARGAGSIETDYLNGEIVLMGRRLGVPTPVNAWFANRAQAMIENNEAFGSVDATEPKAALGNNLAG